VGKHRGKGVVERGRVNIIRKGRKGETSWKGWGNIMPGDTLSTCFQPCERKGERVDARQSLHGIWHRVGPNMRCGCVCQLGGVVAEVLAPQMCRLG